MYGEGVSKEGEIVDLGVDAGIVEKSGSWFSYKGEKLGQGKENVKLLLKQNQTLKDEILSKFKYILIEYHFDNKSKDDKLYYNVLKKIANTHQAFYVRCIASRW